MSALSITGFRRRIILPILALLVLLLVLLVLLLVVLVLLVNGAPCLPDLPLPSMRGYLGDGL